MLGEGVVGDDIALGELCEATESVGNVFGGVLVMVREKINTMTAIRVRISQTGICCELGPLFFSAVFDGDGAGDGVWS